MTANHPIIPFAETLPKLARSDSIDLLKRQQGRARKPSGIAAYAFIARLGRAKADSYTAVGLATEVRLTAPGMGAGLMSHQAHARNRTVLIQESPIAGFQFHRGEAIWPDLSVGEEVSSIRESFNRHDRDAVAVYLRNDKLGYVPRAENSAIAQMLDRGERLDARITELVDDSDPWNRIRFSIFLV